jgi:hypothetical protein
MSLLNSIPHPSTAVYSQLSKRSALLSLLTYAKSHRHSRLWVGAIHMILARTEG